MKILFLTTILPLKPSSGGEIVSKLFVNNLEALGHSVDVVGYLRQEDTTEFIPSNMHLAKKVVIESKTSKLFTVTKLLKSFIHGSCYSSEKYITEEYINSMQSLLYKHDYSLIIIDHFQMGWVLKYLPSNIPIASIAHNVESDLYKQLSDNKNTNFIYKYIYTQEACKMRSLENKIINASKYVWLLTENNKIRYSELFANNENKLTTVCIPPVKAIDLTYSEENIKKWDIGIIGTWTWKANMDGLVWFFENVYPLLPLSITISVAGIGADWLHNKYKNVSYLGFVDSANIFINKSKVIAIPSIAGDGIQIKSIQAIAQGIQIVATSFALRGIDDLPSYVQKADDPIKFKEELLLMISSSKEHFDEATKWIDNRKVQFTKTFSVFS